VKADKTTAADSTLLSVVSGNTIKITSTTAVAKVTNANVQYYLKVALDNYGASNPTSAIHYEPFFVNIKSCLITTFNADADASHTYNLHTGTLYIPYTPFVEVPDATTLRAGASSCGYTKIYSAKWLTYYDTVIDLPYFVVYNQA